MSYTAQQIIDMVNHGAGPNDLYTGSQMAAQMAQAHQEAANDVLQLQGEMTESWQGDAAAQAYAGAGPLVQASQVTGDHLTKAQGLYEGQGGAFKDLQNKVASVGNLGDKPSDDWVSDTPFSFMTNRSDEIAAYNQKSQHVVDGYTTYYGQSTDNTNQWPSQSHYGSLGLPPAGVDIKAAPLPGGGPGTPVDHGGPVNHSGGGPVSHNGGDSSVNNGGGPVNSSVQQSGGPSGHNAPSPGSNGGQPSLQPGHTSTAGYVPPSSSSGGLGNSPSTNYGNGGFGPGSGGAGSSDFGPGTGGFSGGFGPGGGYGGADSGGSGAGSRGGFSSGSGGSGSGAGELGAGKGSGAGSMGSESGTARPGGASASSAAGRPGAPGAGGMGRGGKGEGDEDTEHQRPAYLLENDPDEALIGELPRTSPPVIGL